MIYSTLRSQEILYRSQYNGFEYIVISYGIHPCAYVKIPKEHPLYGMNYSEIDIECHGGLSFSGSLSEILNGEDGFWIGWDYSHYNDYDGSYEKSFGVATQYLQFTKKWSTDEIVEECEEVIDRIVEKYKSNL